MKVHYINILLFAAPLNILAYTHKKPSITPRHIQTTRLLCERELYMSNYDKDPEMKKVMQQFHDRTTQRFQEYDESLQEKRQICKDTCDKEIQKIILKDKIEKELNEKFSALHTDIQSDAIPTCICKKSMTDKVEKGCLRCGGVLGGGVMPGFGAIGGSALYALNQLKPAAITAAIAAAEKAGTAAGIKAGEAAGKNVIIGVLQKKFHLYILNETPLPTFFNSTLYTDITTIATAIDTEMNTSCSSTLGKIGNEAFCGLRETFNTVAIPGGPVVDQKTEITKVITEFVRKAKLTAKIKADEVSSATSSEIITKQTSLIEAGFNSSTTSIYSSIIAIVVIVLIMVIIYLILRYRRKNKMKKKLQYIKLLEE
ncbi:PIR protein, putative [Plasmodium sp.]|nr:PIR protein, putative [Plasmodium sp.]